MYRNWKQIATEAVAQERLVDLYHGNLMSQLKQVYSISYLLYTTNDKDIAKTREAVYKIIDNSFDELTGEEVKAQVDDYLEHRVCYDSWKKCYDKDTTIYVTEDEMNYINNLDISYDAKKLLLGLMLVIKYNKKVLNLPIMDKKYYGLAWYLVTGDKEWSKVSKRLQLEVNKHLTSKPFTKKVLYRKLHLNFEYTHVICTSTWMNIDADSGKWPVLDIYRGVSDLVDNLHGKQVICPVCGCLWDKRNPKSKTDMCPDCYAKHRKKDRHHQE